MSMRVTIQFLATVLLLAAAGLAAAQSGMGRFTGRVTDDSGGALPGVTVTLTAPHLPGPVVLFTDKVGHYESPPLTPGVYAVTFVMAGFATGTSQVALRPGEVFVVDRQLALAAVTETVTVTGAPPPTPSAAPEPPALSSRPATVPLPSGLTASVCGPTAPAEFRDTVGHIVGHRDHPKRELYGSGDVLLLDAGGDTGMAAGQHVVVRRRFRIGDKGTPLKQATFGEHTAALLQVVQATTAGAVAVVVYACGEFMAGDAIERFEPSLVTAPQPQGEPQFDDPAHVVFGELGREMGTPRELMVIDRGFSRGVVRGQRITIFRRSHGSQGPVVRVGHGTIMAVRAQSATMQIDAANDAVTVGDMVALHR
jgi:hypothetical protein